MLLASQAQAQAQAMEGLTNLKKLQELALEESRASVLDLTREAKMHHNEFLAWQSELHSMHEKLAIGSNAMLEAQVLVAQPSFPIMVKNHVRAMQLDCAYAVLAYCIHAYE